MTTFAATAGPGAFIHEFITTPGLIAVVDGVLAGAITAIIGMSIGLDTQLALALTFGAAVATVALLVAFQYGRVVQARGFQEPRFPDRQAGSSATNR